MVDAIMGAMLADSNSPRILSQMLDTNSPTAAAIAAATGVGAGSVSMSDMHGVSDMSSLNQRQLNQLGRQLGQKARVVRIRMVRQDVARISVINSVLSGSVFW